MLLGIERFHPIESIWLLVAKHSSLLVYRSGASLGARAHLGWSALWSSIHDRFSIGIRTIRRLVARHGIEPYPLAFSGHSAVEFPSQILRRKVRGSGFRLRAPASLTPAKRLNFGGRCEN